MQGTERSERNELTPHDLYNMLCIHIIDYLQNNSMVKFEAALAQLVYEQFKSFYLQSDKASQQTLQNEMNRHIPTRHQIKNYLSHGAIDLNYINTLANFFKLSYTLHNHNPAECYLTQYSNASQ